MKSFGFSSPPPSPDLITPDPYEEVSIGEGFNLTYNVNDDWSLDHVVLVFDHVCFSCPNLLI